MEDLEKIKAELKKETWDSIRFPLYIMCGLSFLAGMTVTMLIFLNTMF
jgi:hypothetical protein